MLYCVLSNKENRQHVALHLNNFVLHIKEYRYKDPMSQSRCDILQSKKIKSLSLFKHTEFVNK